MGRSAGGLREAASGWNPDAASHPGQSWGPVPLLRATHSALKISSASSGQGGGPRGPEGFTLGWPWGIQVAIRIVQVA